MFLKTLKPSAIGLAMALSPIGTVAVFAGPNVDTGPNSAQALVSAISARWSAQAEAKVRKPAARATTGWSGANVAVPKSASLLHFSSGTDRLLDRTGFGYMKQKSVFAEARYRTTDWLHFGGSGALRTQGDGFETTDIAAQLLFGPIFNIGTASGVENAFFVTPKVGPTLARTVIDGSPATTRSTITTEIMAGKRFAIGKNVAFAPAVGEVWQKGYKPSLVVQPIAVSVLL